MHRSAVLFGILMCILALIVRSLLVEYTTREKLLHVVFIDVGQGDATFIQSPSGTEILIDGGPNMQVLSKLPRLLGYFDRTIDIIVATHPDADHIGGLIHVLKRYRVGTVLLTDNVHDTPAYEAFMHAVHTEGAEIRYVRRGDTIHAGTGTAGSTTLSILFPDRSVQDLESNASSIILKVSYGDADLLFMGDAPKSIEAYVAALDTDVLQSEILKIGHHGSRTSTQESFIRVVRPQYGIISSGENNRYGHPHPEVLETLQAAAVQIKNTADVGSISLTTDGESIWIK